MQEDVIKVLLIFHSLMKLEKSPNTTFIALIRTNLGAVEMGDFRPISLINGVYNFISKVLANHMSVLMEKIILKSKNEFVRRR